MKLKLQVIIPQEFQVAIRKLGDLTTLNACQRYSLAKSLRKIKQEMETFEHVREGILKAHGKPVGNGQWQIPTENAASFNAQMRDLCQTEVDLPLPGPIKIDGACSMTASELEAVLDLVECDENEMTRNNEPDLRVVPGPDPGVSDGGV
jgi:hypothetical protein